MRASLFFCWTRVFICLAFASVAASARESASLDGAWEYVKVQSLDDPAPDTGWQPVQVPGTLQGHNYERAWFRRSFELPAEWRGRRVLIEFGGVKFDSRVFVNGTGVGGCFNGYDGFELDITDAVRFGGANALLVGVSDWTALFAGERIELPAQADFQSLRRRPRDKVVGPIGGRFDLYGIWDSVTLTAVPEVYAARCQILPSVSQQRVSIKVKVANAGADSFSGEVTAAVLTNEGAPAAECAPAQIEIAGGGSRSLTFTFNAQNLKPWWPHDPNLYVAEIKVGDDALRERFGYREFITQGLDFYLNGAKTHLLARSWWPHEVPDTDEAIRAKIQMLKDNNVNCFRTHTQPWPRKWYEIADELGLMMIAEAAIFTDDETYQIEQMPFWNNYADHLRAMAGRLRNHPSIVMWSLTNEFCGVRANRTNNVQQNLAFMTEVIRVSDGTRPVVFESDGDPDGAADVIGLHYPSEYPERRLWPDDAYWYDQGILTSRVPKMFWKNNFYSMEIRKKPLYVGEFLWIPDEHPATSTLFYGDEVYTDPRAFHFRAKADAWRMQILACRYHGISGFAPWGYDYIKPDGERRPLLEAQRDMYRPLAAFIRRPAHRFFSDEGPLWLVEFFNDTMQPVTAEVGWELRRPDERVAYGHLTIDLPAGDHKWEKIGCPNQPVSVRTQFSLVITISSDGVERFREQWPVEVFPRKRLELPPRVVLYEPAAEDGNESSLAAYFDENQVVYTMIGSLDDWSGEGILVIGPSRLEYMPQRQTPVIAAPSETYRRLAEKVRAGGRVLSLEQQADADMLPVRLTPQMSTMAFALNRAHPLFEGFEPGDLRWWHSGRVSQNEPVRPVCGAARALVATGSSQGLSHAPLLEIPDGSGLWLVCQHMVGRNARWEPVAALLLERMLAYLDGYTPPQGGTAFCGPPALAEKLRALGLDFFELDDWGGLSATDVALLVLAPDSADCELDAAKIAGFVEQGGRVLVHRPSASAFAVLQRGLNLPLTFQAFQGPVGRAESDDALVQAIAREDLYWVEERPAGVMSAPKRAAGMAETVFGPASGFENGTAFEAEHAARLEGPVVKVMGNELAFGSEGTAFWPVTIVEGGGYTLTLDARGTPCAGAHPVAEIALDGVLLGAVEVNTATVSRFAVAFDAEAGEHTLSVSFTNDGKAGGEDRNLFLDKLSVARAALDESVLAVTAPAAVVRVKKGDGHVVFSGIRWDDAGSNQRRADRFVCTLLAALGGRFHVAPPATVLEAEAMQPNADIEMLTIAQDHVLMAANGWLEQRVKVAEPGTYRLGLHAKGTPAAGVFPIVEISVDGREIGRIECASTAWAEFGIDAELRDGEHVLRFSFVNDARNSNEDRNLWLDRVEVCAK